MIRVCPCPDAIAFSLIQFFSEKLIMRIPPVYLGIRLLLRYILWGYRYPVQRTFFYKERIYTGINCKDRARWKNRTKKERMFHKNKLSTAMIFLLTGENRTDRVWSSNRIPFGLWFFPEGQKLLPPKRSRSYRGRFYFDIIFTPRPSRPSRG